MKKAEIMPKNRNDSDFRNKISRCVFNNSGYCRYKEGCRNQHFQNVCQLPDCDQTCPNRHPKQCKFERRCKFLAKEICAFSHVAEDGTETANKDKIKELEMSYSKLEAISEEKIKTLESVIKSFRKEFADYVKNTEQKSDILENKMKQFKENANKVETNLKKENEKLINNIDTFKAKVDASINKALKEVEKTAKIVVKEALEKYDKSSNLKVEQSMSQLKSDVEMSISEAKRAMENDMIEVNALKEAKDSKKQTKSRLSKAKLKEIKEERILKEFEKDCEKFLEVRKDCGLDIESQKCKKCDFVSHSEGLLRKHRVEDHKLKETYQNRVLGYEIDLNKHIEVLAAMGHDIYTSQCNKCDHKASSAGKLEMHKSNNHEEN